MATATDFALPEATAAGIEAGISGAAPELAAPIATGAAEGLGTTAGALAPAGGALASAASPAVSGLSTVAGEAIPGALAEGAGVAPLTETAVDFSLPASTEAGINTGIEEATAQGATQAAAQGAGQTALQGGSQVASLDSTIGPSTLAQGSTASTSGTLDAFNASAEGSAAQAGQGVNTAELTTGSTTPVTPANPATVSPAGAAPPAVTSMNTATAVPPAFAQSANAQVVQQLGQVESSLAPAQSALAPATQTAGGSSLGNLANGVIDLNTPMAGSPLVDAATQAGGEGLASKAGSWLAKNPMSVLSGLGMAYNMMKGNQPPRYSAELQAQAAALQAQGAQLQGYLTSGTLPPGIGSALSGAHDSAAAAIRSRYANMGMAGSSAEMQDLNNLAQTTVSQGADIANKLLATGVSEQQFASGLYQNLMATSMQQDTNMSNAISGFTNAMAKASAVGS